MNGTFTSFTVRPPVPPLPLRSVSFIVLDSVLSSSFIPHKVLNDHRTSIVPYLHGRLSQTSPTTVLYSDYLCSDSSSTGWTPGTVLKRKMEIPSSLGYP